MRKITIDMEKEINELYKNGATSTELAVKYGVTSNTIIRYVIEPRSPGSTEGKKKINRIGTPQAIATANRLKKEGFKLDYIAKQFEVTVSTIWQWLQESKCC